jgi:hypothetical protein
MEDLGPEPILLPFPADRIHPLPHEAETPLSPHVTTEVISHNEQQPPLVTIHVRAELERLLTLPLHDDVRSAIVFALHRNASHEPRREGLSDAELDDAVFG